MAPATIADMIAGAIGARFSGGWWRASTEHCHGGDSHGGLAFRSPDDDPDKLIVHCYSRNCHESVEGRNRARDNLRAAAGLPEWRPGNPLKGAQGPYQAQNRGKTPFERPIGAGKDAESRSERTSAPDRVGKNDYAARLWNQATVSTGQAPPEHPVSRWLARRDLWPRPTAATKTTAPRSVSLWQAGTAGAGRPIARLC